MAYLKGGTVIDGNVYIEGGLRVKSIVDATGGKMPHLAEEGSSVSGRIIKFIDANAAISYSLIEESIDGNNEIITIIGPDANNFGTLKVRRKKYPVDEGVDLFEIGGISTPSGGASSYSLSIKTTPDKISLGGKKTLTGLKKDSSGSIIIEGEKYSKVNDSDFTSFPPDAFYYE